MLNQYTAAIVTNSDGAATVYVGSRIRGQIVAIQYAPGTIDTGATVTITGETTGIPIITKASAGTSTVYWYPLAACVKAVDGSASTNEANIWLYCERMKVVVASGGNTLTGSITLWVDEPVE